MVFGSKKKPKRLTSKSITRDEIEEEINRDIEEEDMDDDEELEEDDDEEEERPKKKPTKQEPIELNYSEMADIVEGNFKRAFGSWLEFRQNLKI